jgi:hypothetical protein
MWNFKKRSLPEQKDFVLYRNYKPARIVSAERRGRNLYLLLSWTNLTHKNQAYEKWVKASECVQYTPPGKKTLYQEIYGNTVAKFNWFQKLIVKLKIWWYGKY